MQSCAPSAAESWRQQVAEHEPGPQQSCLDRRTGDSQSLCGLFDAQVLHVTQHEHLAVYVSQCFQCLRQLLADFFPLQSLGRNLPPVGEVSGDVVPLRVLAINDRLNQMGTLLPSPHTRLINGNLNQPGTEACFSAELPNVLERLQHCLLCRIFSISL